MTHPGESPTWNGNRDEVEDDRTDEVRHFQPTDAVRDAWEETRRRADALDASVLVIQTPPGFDASEEHGCGCEGPFRVSTGAS